MELIDYNPMIGRWTFAGDDPHTGDTIIEEKFDKAHALQTVDRTRLMQRDGLGKGEGIRLHCSIPPYVQVEMVNNYGVDLKDLDAVFKIVRTDYPHLIVNKA